MTALMVGLGITIAAQVDKSAEAIEEVHGCEAARRRGDMDPADDETGYRHIQVVPRCQVNVYRRSGQVQPPPITPTVLLDPDIPQPMEVSIMHPPRPLLTACASPEDAVDRRKRLRDVANFCCLAE